VTTFGYDSRGNLLTTTFPDGSTKTSTYDSAGQLTAEIDQAGRTTTFAYDDAGNLASVTDAAGEIVTYGYDVRRNRTAQTDANGHTTTMEYDALDRLTRRIRPLGQLETFTYDLASNLATHTDFAGQTITYGYDGDYRETSRTLPGGTIVATAYSPNGYRTQAGGDAYVYDVRGRLTKETKASGEVLAYTWDGVGNRTSITTPQGTSTFTYDELNRLETVVDATGTTTYGYDAVGNLTSTAYPNGVTTTHAYDDLNRLTSVVTTGPGGLIASDVYTLGAAGNRTQVVESGPGTQSRSVVYLYDAVYRLTGEQVDAPGTLNDHTVVYGYDAVGNRVEVERDGVTTTLVYDANDRLLSETTGAAVTTYAYDANGNLRSRVAPTATDAYDYDAENRMVAASVQSGAHPGPVTFGYDADGMRTQATSGGATTTYLTDKSGALALVVAETTGAASVGYTYGHDLISQTRAGTGARFHHHDGQLSTRQLTDASGTTTDTYTYDAFGILLAVTGSSPNAFLYAGEQLDPNVGFYYLRARYYDAPSGRFTSTDPEQGSVFDPVSLHRYLYANADPVNKADPTGRMTIAEIAIRSLLIGIVAGIVTYAVTGSITLAIGVGATVAAISFFALYFLGGLSIGSGFQGAIKEGLQIEASGGISPTLRGAGRLLGCAALISVNLLLKLPVEDLLTVPGIVPPGVSGLPEGPFRDGKVKVIVNNLKNVRKGLQNKFGRTGVGCPAFIRGLPF
jgi:RHS repeat-associated protein